MIAVETIVEHKCSLSYNEPERISITTLEYKAMKVDGISRCENLLSDSTPDLFCRVFPELLPLSEGHPNSERPVKVSMEQCVAHYLQLSNRSFSRHPTFTLATFDMVSRKRALMASSISCKVRPHDNTTIASATRTKLAKKLNEDVKLRNQW